MLQKYDSSTILQALPHRYPMLLVDRILSLNEKKAKITALKNVSFNEPFFQGHFPDLPVMPGVLIIEGLAQAACLLAKKIFETEQEKTFSTSGFFFASIEKVKFRGIVSPGDQLLYIVDLLSHKKNFWQFTGKAYVAEKIVVEVDHFLGTAKTE